MTMNPLWWLHIRVAGRPRSHLYMGLGYLAIVLLCTTISYRFYTGGGTSNWPAKPGAFFSVWLMIVSGAQAVFLLLLIPSAIKRAVQRDYQSGMADSHRISPMGGSTIVLGYMLGPAIPSLVLFGLGLFVGSYFAAKSAATMGVGIAAGARVFVGGWLLLQVLLIVAAVLMSSIALLSAIATREGKFNIIGLLIAGSFFGGLFAVALVPGLALLTGVMGASYLFASLTKSAAMGGAATLATSTLLQTALSITLLVAAARKFRAPERALFPVPISLVLLGLWGLASVLGFAHYEHNALTAEMLDDMAVAQIGFSTVAFLLVSLFATYAAASGRVRLDRAAVFAPGADATRARIYALMPLFVAGLTMLVLKQMICWMDPSLFSARLLAVIDQPLLWAAVAIAVLLSCWMDYNLFYFAAARRVKVWFVLLVGWGLLRIGPPMLDGMIDHIVREVTGESWTWHGCLTAISPIGTLMRTMEPCYEIGYGLAVQALLAGLAFWLARKARRRLAVRPGERAAGRS